MTTLGRSQAVGVTNPALDFIAVDSSRKLYTPFALSFQVYDPAGLQVFPASLGAKHSVDLVAEKLATGRFCATWAGPASNATIGRWSIAWYVTETASSAQVRIDREFEVVAAGAGLREVGYCLVADLRDEGVQDTVIPDLRAARIIALQSRYIERITGRQFYVSSSIKTFDGRGGRALLLNEPIVALGSLKIMTSQLNPNDLDIEDNYIRVYNRHLTEGLLQPDDRNNPRIEFVHVDDGIAAARPSFSRLIWPRGQRNITVDAAWGYTESDGTPTGRTPTLLAHVCKLLVMRELWKMGSQRDRREDAQRRHRLLDEHTRDQGYRLGPDSLGGAFTGDAEIDQLLAMFARPPALGAA